MDVSYIVYRVTKRFTTSGFDTLKAFFEHRLGSPMRHCSWMNFMEIPLNLTSCTANVLL
jgi:hypothetical protein